VISRLEDSGKLYYKSLWIESNGLHFDPNRRTTIFPLGEGGSGEDHDNFYGTQAK
jgi:hypothetical protein